MSAELVSWTLLAAVAYAYVGYPLLVWAASRVMPPRTMAPVDLAAAHVPSIAIVFASRDELATVASRLRNLTSLNYPPARLELLVGLDGAASPAGELDEWLADPRVTIVRSADRVGKTALLNRLIASSSADLVVFTDANAEFDRDALRYLAARFDDPGVGCVTGELVYCNDAEPVVRAGEGLYWRLENAIKKAESRFGGTLVVSGAIYAIRRSLVAPLPPDVSDDSTNPLRALAAGRRVEVEPRARAYERAATRLDEEFQRKARMVTRQLGAHAQVGFFLVPFRPLLALRLASHKWLRWLVPYFLLASAAINLAVGGPLQRAMLLTLAVGVSALCAGTFLQKRRARVPSILRLWTYFCTVNAAAFVGVFDFIRRRQRVVWAISPSTRS
ncbi:MAG: glycosyltransferase [Acidobacteria bacterium]|nr:glycosyltransferase [Acidobacteriota bacterium]